MRKQQMGTTVDHKPYAEMKTYAQEVGETFVGMDASNPLKNYIHTILEMASWRGCARVNLYTSTRESFGVLFERFKSGCHFQSFWITTFKKIKLSVKCLWSPSTLKPKVSTCR